MDDNEYPYPDSGFSPVINPEADGVGDGNCAVRCLVSLAYRDFRRPSYDENGAFDLSLIPLGMLGHYIFLKEDPDYIYVVPLGNLRCDPVAVARKRLAKHLEGIGTTMSP